MGGSWLGGQVLFWEKIFLSISEMLRKNLHLRDAEKKSPSHRCWLAPNGSSGRKKCGSARNEYVREEGSLSISNHIVKIHRTDLSRRGSSCTSLCYISLFLGCWNIDDSLVGQLTTDLVQHLLSPDMGPSSSCCALSLSVNLDGSWKWNSVYFCHFLLWGIVYGSWRLVN